MAWASSCNSCLPIFLTYLMEYHVGTWSLWANFSVFSDGTCIVESFHRSLMSCTNSLTYASLTALPMHRWQPYLCIADSLTYASLTALPMQGWQPYLCRADSLTYAGLTALPMHRWQPYLCRAGSASEKYFCVFKMSIPLNWGHWICCGILFYYVIILLLYYFHLLGWCQWFSRNSLPSRWHDSPPARDTGRYNTSSTSLLLLGHIQCQIQRNPIRRHLPVEYPEKPERAVGAWMPLWGRCKPSLRLSPW